MHTKQGYVSNLGASKCTECPAGFVYVPESCTDNSHNWCDPHSNVCVNYVAPTCKHCSSDVCPSSPAPAPTKSSPGGAGSVISPSGSSPDTKDKKKAGGKRARSLREMEEMIEMEV